MEIRNYESFKVDRDTGNGRFDESVGYEISN